MFQTLKTILTALVSLSGDSDIDMVDMSLDDTESVDNEEEDVEEGEEGTKSFLVKDEDLEAIKVEYVEGDKPGSTWLLVNDVFFCHRYQSSELETFWECSRRRKDNCPFKIGTYKDEDGMIKVSYMYKIECHDCGQTKLWAIMHKFRNTLKQRMKEDYKIKFHNVFNEEKKALINRYQNNPDLLEQIVYELKDKRSYRVAAQRAKQKCFPKNPKCHEDIDLDKIGLGHLVLGRSAHFDPEVKDKDVILLGTPVTAEAWARSEFKSGDGTFKICPKMFYQVKDDLTIVHSTFILFAGFCLDGSIWRSLSTLLDWTSSRQDQRHVWTLLRHGVVLLRHEQLAQRLCRTVLHDGLREEYQRQLQPILVNGDIAWVLLPLLPGMFYMYMK